MEGKVISEPVWVITTYTDATQKAVEFSQLFAVRFDIKTALLLWDTNSYYINVEGRYFIINGGRKIAVNNEFGDSVNFLYARRVQQSVSLFTSKGKITKPEVAYLLGLQGAWEGPARYENNELFVHVSEDGKSWKWGNKR